MGGTSTQRQTSTQKQSSQTNPWEPTLGPLKDIVGQIQGQFGNTGVTGAETGALDTLLANAQQGNPFASQITQLATDLFAGGPDRTGIVNDAYAQYQNGAQPYLSQDYLNPYTNPAFKQYQDTLTNDISNRVNSMFAGAGRDLSGAHLQTLSRGIAEGTAPTYANQYNQNVATQTGLLNNLFNAGGSTASALAGLDQNRFANRGAGVAAAEQAMQARDAAPMGILNAESLRRNLPLSSIANIENLLLPIAGLGGQSTGKGQASSTGTNTMSGAQQFATIAGGLNSLFSGAKNAGQASLMFGL